MRGDKSLARRVHRVSRSTQGLKTGLSSFEEIRAVSRKAAKDAKENPSLVLSEEIRAFNAVQPFSGCSAGRASQPLAQGAAEKPGIWVYLKR